MSCVGSSKLPFTGYSSPLKDDQLKIVYSQLKINITTILIPAKNSQIRTRYLAIIHTDNGDGTN